jgi:hypothetical protein
MTTELNQQHVLPLMNIVRRLRAQGRPTPDVDPNGGGIFAKVLFLLTTASPDAVKTGIISPDNPDRTARNMRLTLSEAGFARRSDMVFWNVVPYYVSTKDQNRNPTAAQIREAIPHTQAFVDELKELRVVVYCGKQAQKAHGPLRFPKGVHQLDTFHLADRSYSHLDKREDIQATFKRAYDLAMRRQKLVAKPPPRKPKQPK